MGRKVQAKHEAQIINQKEIVKGLENLMKKPNELPHSLFTGSAGIGKTTTALCFAKQMLER